jgi:hypothetical protein
MPRTALIVAVPEAEDAVGALRLAHDPSARNGAPAHITILVPFVPSGEIDEAAIAAVVGQHDAFAFELRSLERFPEGGVYLAPVPAAPFARLTRAIWDRWPEHPPYEGAHDTVIPHLTLSREPIDVSIALPIAARAHEVTLIEETEPDGRWVRRATFALRSAPS